MTDSDEIRADVEPVDKSAGRRDCTDICVREAAAQLLGPLRPSACVCAHGVKRRLDRLMKEARRG